MNATQSWTLFFLALTLALLVVTAPPARASAVPPVGLHALVLKDSHGQVITRAQAGTVVTVYLEIQNTAPTPESAEVSVLITGANQQAIGGWSTTLVCRYWLQAFSLTFTLPRMAPDTVNTFDAHVTWLSNGYPVATPPITAILLVDPLPLTRVYLPRLSVAQATPPDACVVIGPSRICTAS